MKLTARDSAAFLKAPDRQCAGVLLYGPDAGLIRERSRAIAALILGAQADPLNRVDLTAEQVKSDPALLRDELSALSLMGGRRLVVLQGAGDKLSGAIESAFDGLSTTTYLIVEAEELAASSSLRGLFEKHAQLAALPCYHDEGRGLEDTLRASLAAHGLSATGDAMHYLLAHLGNDRGITRSEIEKLALYLGEERQVSLPIAMLLVGHNASESMEDICHAVACGNARETHALLARLMHEGTQPVAILRSLLRHFQRLDIARAHIASGMQAEQALAALRPPVFFKYAPLMRRELSLWNARSLAQAQNLLLRTEKELKSGHLAPALVAGQALAQASRLAAA